MISLVAMLQVVAAMTRKAEFTAGDRVTWEANGKVRDALLLKVKANNRWEIQYTTRKDKKEKKATVPESELTTLAMTRKIARWANTIETKKTKQLRVKRDRRKINMYNAVFNQWIPGRTSLQVGDVVIFKSANERYRYKVRIKKKPIVKSKYTVECLEKGPYYGQWWRVDVKHLVPLICTQCPGCERDFPTHKEMCEHINERNIRKKCRPLGSLRLVLPRYVSSRQLRRLAASPVMLRLLDEINEPNTN